MDDPALPQGGRVAVIRFSSLGDVILTGAALRELHRRRPDLRIALLTKSDYASLFAAQPWLEVWALDPETGLPGLWRLSRRLRRWRPHLVADLHATLRAWALRLLCPTLPWRRLRKDVAARRRLVRNKRPPAEIRHIVQRYGDVLGVTPEPGPWFDFPRGASRTLALVPGAAWATKRWPMAHWLTLADWWRRRGGDVLWLGGPAEAEALRSLTAASGDRHLLNAPLPEVGAVLANCQAAVANDTGPGHYAAAVGTPVVTLLGPTARAFGFTPWGRHRVVETDLACRPCSFHGDAACPLGHHRCMLELEPAQVISALEHLIARSDSPA